MSAFTDEELAALLGDALLIERLSLFRSVVAARRPDGWDGELGSRLGARHVLRDVAGNVFVKEAEAGGVRLGYVPLDLLDHVAAGGRLAGYAGPPPRRVRVRVERAVRGEARTPFAWALVPSRRAWAEARGRRVATYTQPRIEVSAAPGVSVDPGEGGLGLLAALSRSARARADARAALGFERRTVAVVVRRVQAAPLLPGPDGVGTRSAEAYAAVEAETRLASAVVGRRPYCHVVRRDDGLDLTLFSEAPRDLLPSPFEAPASEEGWAQWAERQGLWLLRNVLGIQPDGAPLTLQVRVPPGSADARFAWAVEEDGDRWIIRIHRTADVRVELADGAGALGAFGQRVAYEEHEVPFDDAGDLEWGVRQPARAPAAAPPVSWVLGVEQGLGMIPVVGELSDLADLVLYATLGTDKWGQEMTRVDAALTLVGLGAIGATGATLRAAYRYGRRLPDEIAVAAKALTPAERRTLDVLLRDVEAVRAGRAADAPPVETLGAGWKSLLASWTLGRLSRALGAQTAYGPRRYAFADFVNHTDDGFFVPDIHEAYVAYRRAAGDAPLAPRAWLREAAPRELRETVETLVGRDAFDLETATTAGAFARAARREAAQPGGPPRGEVGRGWPWDRFGSPDDYAGYVWRRGDPIDAPTTTAKATRRYPSYDTARKRAWQNVAYFELQTRLGRSLDPPPPPEQMWALCRDHGLLDVPRRPTYMGDDHSAASTIELLYMYRSGRAQTDVRTWRGDGWALGAAKHTAKRPSTSESAELARLELRRRFGEDVAGVRSPARLREIVGEASTSRPHGAATPRGYEDLSDEELLRAVEFKASPFENAKLEFEHDVPQRTARYLNAAVALERGEADRLTAQASPSNLFGVRRLEHGFFDAEVDRANLFDDRLGNPFARLGSAEVQALLDVVRSPDVRVRDRARYDQIVAWLDEVAADRWAGLD